MEKYNLKQYKESLLVTNHLEQILKVINLSIRGLHPFRLYMPVAKILNEMEGQKKLLEIHFNKFKKIKESKGKIE